MSFSHPLFYFITAIGLVTVIDTAGALASRYLGFKYEYLSVFSVAVYFGAGYFLGQYYSSFITLILGFLIGVYDGSVGFRLALLCKANYGEYMKEMQPIRGKLWLYAGCLAMMLTGIGYLIS